MSRFRRRTAARAAAGSCILIRTWTPTITFKRTWWTVIGRWSYIVTWRLAAGLIAEGHKGLIAPSFARGAQPGMANIVLWKWGPDLPHRVIVHDPSGRLPKDQLSWRPRIPQQPATLNELMEDYVAHMHHHLRQIGAQTGVARLDGF